MFNAHVQLITSRIDNLTRRLIHTLLKVVTIHTVPDQYLVVVGVEIERRTKIGP